MSETIKPDDISQKPIEIDDWFLANLVCPRDKEGLTFSDSQLRCNAGHVYPVIEGVPVMLIEEAPDTLEVMSASVAKAHGFESNISNPDDLFLETVGISDEEREGVRGLAANPENHIDPVVSYLVAATNGIMYKQLIGQLKQYPIPELPLPNGRGGLFLDIGCSWGRWCIAAVKRNYIPVGLDPSLGAIMAAKRVASQLGLPIKYIVGDARCLPFKTRLFQAVFSYSVIQHFSYQDANQTIRETARVLTPNGTCFIQLPNAYGLRCLYHQARRAFRDPQGFEVRYWTLKQMEQTFGEYFHVVSLTVDCFFGIGLQASDSNMMPVMKRVVINASEFAKKVSAQLPIFARVADSIWIKGIGR